MDRMSETPNRVIHHRRAHSDATLRFDDFLLFDPSDIDLSSLDLLPSPTPPRVTPMTVDSDDSSASKSHAPPPQPPKLNHLRSLSVDSDFFDSFDVVECGEKKRGKHGHSNSMDGCCATAFEAESSGNNSNNKKALDADRLAELALIDPKRAKRILANRQSAARSKERKIRYTSELERKVQTLQAEATTLSAKVTLLQRDTTGLNTENKELKLRLQAMEQQAQLRDALNEALKEEVQRLRIAAGQVPAVNGSPFNQASPQFSPHQPSGAQFGSNHQAHQSQQQFHAQQSSANNQLRQEHQNSSFVNFGQKF